MPGKQKIRLSKYFAQELIDTLIEKGYKKDNIYGW